MESCKKDQIIRNDARKKIIERLVQKCDREK